VVETIQQLDEALHAAARDLESFSLLEVRLAPDDTSAALQRLTATLGRAAQGRT
jgi:hypothetical protein